MSCDIGWALLILQPFRRFTYVTAHSPTLPLLHLCHSSFCNPSFASPTSQVLHLRHLASRPWTRPALEANSRYATGHSSFSNPSVASPTSQLILQPFFRFSYVTGFSLTAPGEPSQLILQPFPRFTYGTTHSPTLPLLHLRHSSFCNPSFASPTSQALHLIHLASRPWLKRIYR